ncbi:MAG: hypothetical protein QXV45_01695 [Candidatus Bathyarchaeia archaeon]
MESPLPTFTNQKFDSAEKAMRRIGAAWITDMEEAPLRALMP